MNSLPVRALFALCIASGALAAEPPATDAELYTRLRDPAQAEDAFARLASAKVSRTVGGHSFPGELFFKYVQPTFVRQSNGAELAFVQLTMETHLCGNGSYDGGVQAPQDFSARPWINKLMIFDPSGKLTDIVNGYDNMAVYDAAGDGKNAELIQWANNTHYDRRPFLIIHDLSKPDFPAMLNIVFNPHMTEREYKKDENGILIIPDRMEDMPKPPHATRFARWSFAPQKDSRLNDIVIEEKKGDKYEEVARLVFDPKARRWNGPPGDDDEVWKAGNEDHFRAQFDSSIRLESHIYKKYDPNAAPAKIVAPAKIMDE